MGLDFMIQKSVLSYTKTLEFIRTKKHKNLSHLQSIFESCSLYILWRYLINGYLHIFSLSVFTFISVLLVSRFKEIARFTALSSNPEKTALFVAYQIPLILPIAIPISALIASLLLFQRLSRSFELTALRASGMSLYSILSPILLISLLLALFNFSFCAEISPFCRRESKSLLYHETSANPLLLLQRQNLIKVKNSYVKMKTEEDGKIAKDLFLITHNQSNDRLSLVTARKLRMNDSAKNTNSELELLGHNVSIVTHLQSEKKEMFDPLIIENQFTMATDASALSSTLKKNRPRLDATALEFPMLRLRSEGTGKIARKASIEIYRRITLSLAVFSFTFLGCSFGIEQGRNPSKRNLFIAMSLTLLLMMSYLLGKEFKGNDFVAMLIFLFPHPILWLASLRQLQKTTQGK